MGQKSIERGLKTRRKVLGDEWVDQSERNKTAFNAEFHDLLHGYCWDAIWNRPGLAHKMRRVVVLSITLANGRWEEYKLHARAALESGDLTEDELKEILLQAAVYAGVPTANTGFREAREVLAAVAAKRKPAAKKRR
ncbi:MAG TPA: carboxymuconolactone decarboxylase family protein [Usitatibacter sp.]|nr:carboxymuconolactone decarboxylase family protein [Usitatibacter sp.]